MADVKKFLAKAQDCLRRNNAEAALHILHEALKVNPGDAELRRTLRDAARKHAAGAKAGMLKLKPMQMKIWGLQKAAKWAACDLECEQYLALSAEDAKVLLASGEALIELKAFDAAEVQLDAAVALDGRNGVLLKALGRACKGKRDYVKARRCYQQVLKAVPTDREAAVALKDIEALDMTENKGWGSEAKAVDMIKDKEQARDLEQAQAIVKDESHLAGRIASLSGRLAGGAGDRNTLRELWGLQRMARDFAGAVATLKRLTELEPNVFEYTENIADLKIEHAREGLEQLRTQLERSGDEAVKAPLEERRRKLHLFQVKEWERRVAQYPNNAQLRYELGNHLLAAGEYDAAVKHFQAARREPRFAPDADVKIGIIFYARGRHSMAAKQFQKLLEPLAGMPLDERKMEILYWVARTRIQAGEHAPAIDVIEGLMLEDASYRNIEALMSAAEAGGTLNDDDLSDYL